VTSNGHLETRSSFSIRVKFVDCCLIHPGGREKIYQGLGGALTAMEPPLWCRLVTGHVVDRGFEAEIIDCDAEDLSSGEVAGRVAEMNPRLVVIVAAGHQPSASTQSMVSSGQIATAIKTRHPKIPILILGGHVSALPERTLREEDVDFACKGEGPETVTALLAALRDGGNAPRLEKVPGLVHWVDGKPRVNPPAPLIEDLDGALHGNVWTKLPMQAYRAHNWQCFGEPETRLPYASIYTTLGCPYRCSFCCINAPFESNRYRRRSPDAVAAEITYLRDEYGIHTFKIIDEMFVLNDTHVEGVCDRLIAAGGDFNIWAYARVDTVKSGHLDKLRRAGIRWLALGIESGSAHVRDGARKALKSDDIIDVVRAIQGAGINVIGNYIFGLPDDDLDSVRETLDLALELNCEFANFYAAMAYPGSPLYNLALRSGWELPSSWAGYSQHSFDTLPLRTEAMTAAEVLRFRDQAFQEYFSAPSYLDMVARKFGKATVAEIEQMQSVPLARRLLQSQTGDQAALVGAR
jgi:anaerobic magnesium-protoporphyrin IX monomethyl ester cyclase